MYDADSDSGDSDSPQQQIERAISQLYQVRLQQQQHALHHIHVDQHAENHKAPPAKFRVDPLTGELLEVQGLHNPSCHIHVHKNRRDFDVHTPTTAPMVHGNDRNDSGGTMVTLAVQCPEGYIPGTILTVMSPDGLTVNAQVPDACAPGGTFHVIYKKPA